jgi:hypothetical protein
VSKWAATTALYMFHTSFGNLKEHVKDLLLAENFKMEIFVVGMKQDKFRELLQRSKVVQRRMSYH